MTAKENFISEIEKLLTTNTINEDAMNYFTEFKNGTVKNSSVITEKGVAVLRFLQTQPSTNYAFTAKMIAEELNMNTRSISGTMRKLLNDGYVEKLTTLTPITYQITPAGLAFDLDKIENK